MSQTVTRADSAEEQDPHNNREEKKPKSRRPASALLNPFRCPFLRRDPAHPRDLREQLEHFVSMGAA